jgi:hypothetical protein
MTSHLDLGRIETSKQKREKPSADRKKGFQLLGVMANFY